MILFFTKNNKKYTAVQFEQQPQQEDIQKLSWLFGQAKLIEKNILEGPFVGPRKEMITPWCTNAIEITMNMGIKGINRMEEYENVSSGSPIFDPMLQAVYKNLDQEIFSIHKSPEPILYIEDIAEYNQKEGLALNLHEIKYLEKLSERLGRKLTDSEIFGFSQVNSEHCRHKIFNGSFIIDGKEKDHSLFQLIKLTTKTHPNKVVSAYKDNCAFIEGPVVEQFAPIRQDLPEYFEVKDFKSVISLKAETHNFPTTVEPFNGAATGTGGEIRDRIAGGKGAFPIAGTAVYMTAYPRLENGRDWEKNIEPRKWLYQTPGEILIKASNGASDFGNKFGQPLICGSVLTFEHEEDEKTFGYDKVIMLAGGIGYGKKKDSLKDTPKEGEKVILMGGDNYRIGMGGGAVSSVATGEYENAIELNAVQRSNPEMQKRVYNAIRAMAESDENPIVSIHDHGAGGHLNCFSELVEDTGGIIRIDQLPIGDPTLSSKEIVGNESQERMGIVLKEKDTRLLENIAERERAPFYIAGETTGNHQFTFVNNKNGEKPIDLQLIDIFGNPPKALLEDTTKKILYKNIQYSVKDFEKYLKNVLQLESVACKDYLTNKVDRSVTGRIAMQQCAGEIQLPLNNLGVVTMDYKGESGMATSIGHAPVAGLVDPAKGSILSISESLTNIIWAPIEGGIKGISLSANWMWPCKNPGEDARLYEAVQAASDFAIQLGINIPTGKDSLSMTQKYPGGKTVFAPGTVIISAAGEVIDIKKSISPVVKKDIQSALLYIDLSSDNFKLGGSSFAQVNNVLGNEVPTVKDANYFAQCFELIQELIGKNQILSGHDISAGGLITSLLEMNFANREGGMDISLSEFEEPDEIKILFSENPALVIQVKNIEQVIQSLTANHIAYAILGKPTLNRQLTIAGKNMNLALDINEYRDYWYKTSYLLDSRQSGEKLASARFENYKNQPLDIRFTESFTGKFEQYRIDPRRRAKTGIKAAIIREKGVNGDREMAWSMYLAGMDVKDVHMTDLVSGRETLEDINMIVFVGGFSNSDVLGSAKGWAGAFLYNEKAKQALDNFYARQDTLSLGICNGCQLMVELGLIAPGHEVKPAMLHNESGKFESAFLGVSIPSNPSVMLGSLEGSSLGIWVAHGEGKFHLPYPEDKYNVVAKYSYQGYPGNPNGSPYNIAGICSDDGRHLAMMPHLERSIYPWQWAYYPGERNDQITPWIEAFVNAREWISKKIKD